MFVMLAARLLQALPKSVLARGILNNGFGVVQGTPEGHAHCGLDRDASRQHWKIHKPTFQPVLDSRYCKSYCNAAENCVTSQVLQSSKTPTVTPHNKQQV